MDAAEVCFRCYLRSEVDAAGERYERASESFFALMGGPTIEPGPDLLEATEAFSEALRLYIGALRRLAHYSAHQVSLVQREPVLAHA